MSSPTPPLLETRRLACGGASPVEVGTMEVVGPWISCVGSAQILVSAFRDPELIEEGALLLSGKPPVELLGNCEAAYVPRELPLPASTRALEAIHLSGRLVGLSKSDAEEALARCRLGAHGQKKLGELTRLQRRLLSLAHGICGGPRILILEDLHADLDEAETEIVESLLDRELADRQLIASVGSASPGARALMLRTDQVLVGTGSQILPPQVPSSLTTEGFWVTCNGDAADLAQVLTESGARVKRSPRAAVLLVHGATGLAIYRSAAQAGVSVLELSPNSAESFVATRARSGA